MRYSRDQAVDICMRELRWQVLESISASETVVSETPEPTKIVTHRRITAGFRGDSLLIESDVSLATTL